MSRLGRDPYWLDARFDGKCAGDKGACQVAIRKGERAFYYPNSRMILAKACGHADAAAADFNSCLFDERGF
jgi:hypothetical protein